MTIDTSSQSIFIRPQDWPLAYALIMTIKAGLSYTPTLNYGLGGSFVTCRLLTTASSDNDRAQLLNFSNRHRFNIALHYNNAYKENNANFP